MENLICIADEPYTWDELMFKTDPEECMWHAEMASWIESNYEELTRWK